jgi:hypothetical protein
MEAFLDSLTVRIVAGLIITMMGFALWHSFDIYQFFARTDFGNVNAYFVLFTRHDKEPKDDRVVFELLGYKIPLRDICRNRFLFWFIILCSMRVTNDLPVLNFGTHRTKVLAPVRGRVSQMWSSMVLKRASGLPFREIPCQLSLVLDRSEGSTNYVIRIMLIPDRDIENFDAYLKDPPMNTDNFAFVGKIVDAHRSKTGSFINVRVTTA